MDSTIINETLSQKNGHIILQVVIKLFCVVLQTISNMISEVWNGAFNLRENETRYILSEEKMLDHLLK